MNKVILTLVISFFQLLPISISAQQAVPTVASLRGQADDLISEGQTKIDQSKIVVSNLEKFVAKYPLLRTALGFNHDDYYTHQIGLQARLARDELNNMQEQHYTYKTIVTSLSQASVDVVGLKAKLTTAEGSFKTSYDKVQNYKDWIYRAISTISNGRAPETIFASFNNMYDDSAPFDGKTALSRADIEQVGSDGVLRLSPIAQKAIMVIVQEEGQFNSGIPHEKVISYLQLNLNTDLKNASFRSNLMLMLGLRTNEEQPNLPPDFSGPLGESAATFIRYIFGLEIRFNNQVLNPDKIVSLLYYYLALKPSFSELQTKDLGNVDEFYYYIIQRYLPLRDHIEKLWALIPSYNNEENIEKVKLGLERAFKSFKYLQSLMPKLLTDAEAIRLSELARDQAGPNPAAEEGGKSCRYRR